LDWEWPQQHIRSERQFQSLAHSKRAVIVTLIQVPHVNCRPVLQDQVSLKYSKQPNRYTQASSHNRYQIQAAYAGV